MTTTGEKTLSSGNVARWTREEGLHEFGAISVDLSNPATLADADEIQALMNELKPPGSVTIERGATDDEGHRAVRARIDDALYGGRSSN